MIGVTLPLWSPAAALVVACLVLDAVATYRKRRQA